MLLLLRMPRWRRPPSPTARCGLNTTWRSSAWARLPSLSTASACTAAATRLVANLGGKPWRRTCRPARRPTHPPARPGSARASAGRPPGLGQPRPAAAHWHLCPAVANHANPCATTQAAQRVAPSGRRRARCSSSARAAGPRWLTTGGASRPSWRAPYP